MDGVGRARPAETPKHRQRGLDVGEFETFAPWAAEHGIGEGAVGELFSDGVPVKSFTDGLGLLADPAGNVAKVTDRC